MSTHEGEVSKARAASFVRHVLGDEDRADEIEDLDLDEWAEQRGVEITENPSRSIRRQNTMTRTQRLEKRVIELEEQVAEFEEREEQILGLLGVESDEDEELEADEDEELDEDEQDES